MCSQPTLSNNQILDVRLIITVPRCCTLQMTEISRRKGQRIVNKILSPSFYVPVSAEVDLITCSSRHDYHHCYSIILETSLCLDAIIPCFILRCFPSKYCCLSQCRIMIILVFRNLANWEHDITFLI